MPNRPMISASRNTLVTIPNDEPTTVEKALRPILELLDPISGVWCQSAEFSASASAKNLRRVWSVFGITLAGAKERSGPPALPCLEHENAPQVSRPIIPLIQVFPPFGQNRLMDEESVLLQS